MGYRFVTQGERVEFSVVEGKKGLLAVEVDVLET